MSESMEVTAIKIEKRLCAALLRQWAPSGMSVESLSDDAASEIERLRAGKKTWYVLKVEGGYELSVASDLCRHDYKACVPKVFERRVVGREAYPIPYPKWSGYVFVCVCPKAGQNYRDVLATPHAIDFVSLAFDKSECALNPSAISEEMIAGWAMDEHIDWHEATKPPSKARKCVYASGDKVRVIAIGHPYEGWEGTVKDARPGSANIYLGPNNFPVRVKEDDIMLVSVFQQRASQSNVRA